MIKRIIDQQTQEGWQTPTLLNGFTTYTAESSVRYRKNQFGNVEFKGAVKDGNLNSSIFELPSAYRPNTTKYWLVYTGGSVWGKIQIGSNGSVLCVSYSSTLLALDGISFPLT